MLICDCGFRGTNLIPHKDGTSRCPQCMRAFAGIPAEKAIYDLESVEWKSFTKECMKKSDCSWVFAWNHYNYFKKHYDSVREITRN